MIVGTSRGRHYYFAAREDHPLGGRKGGVRQLQHRCESRKRLGRRPGSLHAGDSVRYTIQAAVDRPRSLTGSSSCRAGPPGCQWHRQRLEPGCDTNGTSTDSIDYVSVDIGEPLRGLAAVPAIIRGPRPDSGGKRETCSSTTPARCGRGRCRMTRLGCSQGDLAALEQPPTATTALPLVDALSKLQDVYRGYPAGPSAEYRIDDSATESTPEAAATEFTVKVAEEAARIGSPKPLVRSSTARPDQANRPTGPRLPLSI